MKVSVSTLAALWAATAMGFSALASGNSTNKPDVVMIPADDLGG